MRTKCALKSYQEKFKRISMNAIKFNGILKHLTKAPLTIVFPPLYPSVYSYTQEINFNSTLKGGRPQIECYYDVQWGRPLTRNIIFFTGNKKKIKHPHLRIKIILFKKIFEQKQIFFTQ